MKLFNSWHRSELVTLAIIAVSVVGYFCGWFTP